LLDLLFNTEGGGSMFFPKAYDLLPDYTTSQMYSSQRQRLRHLTKGRHILPSVGMLQDSYDYNCDYNEHTTGLKYNHDFKMGLDTKTDRLTDCDLKYLVRAIEHLRG
jgi:hypothetical protein